MRIGVDLDNTIISYDALFHSAAVARGLIAADEPAEKNAVKTRVQSAHGGAAWTRLQGEVYGPLVHGARPFPGALDFFRRCRSAGFEVCILSHKSRFAAAGPRHDLRAAARRWLDLHGMLKFDETGLGPDDVEFHDTREEKVRAIGRRRCDVFIDDLPEVFDQESFPSATSAILFDPAAIHLQRPDLNPAKSWSEIAEAVFAARSA